MALILADLLYLTEQSAASLVQAQQLVDSALWKNPFSADAWDKQLALLQHGAAEDETELFRRYQMFHWPA